MRVLVLRIEPQRLLEPGHRLGVAAAHQMGVGGERVSDRAPRIRPQRCQCGGPPVLVARGRDRDEAVRGRGLRLERERALGARPGSAEVS